MRMADQTRFGYEPTDEEPLSVAIVRAVAMAHQEDVHEQNWMLANYINPDALSALFSDEKRNMHLTFEVDATTVIVDVDKWGDIVIEIESHR